jgi:hypothetical protein
MEINKAFAEYLVELLNQAFGLVEASNDGGDWKDTWEVKAEIAIMTLKKSPRPQPMKLSELIQLTKLWFEEVGLTTKGTPIKQAEKGVEEANEYLVACIAGTREEQINELGDKFVTLIGDSIINGITLEEALYSAYTKINNPERKNNGKIVDGSFVKAEDLTDKQKAKDEE